MAVDLLTVQRRVVVEAAGVHVGAGFDERQRDVVVSVVARLVQRGPTCQKVIRISRGSNNGHLQLSTSEIGHVRAHPLLEQLLDAVLVALDGRYVHRRLAALVPVARAGWAAAAAATAARTQLCKSKAKPNMRQPPRPTVGRFTCLLDCSKTSFA